MHIEGNGGHAKVVRDILSMFAQHHHFEGKAFIAIGNNEARKRESIRLGEKFSFMTIIHPDAVIARTATIGEGSIIMAGVVIQANAKVGRHAIINTNASIDHDCVIGDFVHVSPGAAVCGCVEVGDGAWVGAGAICVQGAFVPPWTLVRAGSLVKSADWRERCRKLGA